MPPPHRPIALYELALDAAGIGTFDWDLVSGRLVWDERLMTLFDYDPQTFTESIEAFNARLHPDDLPRITADLDRAIAAVGVFDAEYRLLLPDGSQRWIGARGEALPGPDGTAVRLIGAAYDTTDRRAAEAQVAAVLESMTTAFFSLDTDWRFRYVNAEATKLLDRTRDDLLGGVIWDLFPAANGSDFETHYRQVMDTGEAVTFDAYYPEPLDAWYEVRASRTPDGLAVYFVDVTTRRRVQQEAANAAERADLLSRITIDLVGTLDHREAAARLAGLLVPTLCDWCVVTLVDDMASPGSRDGLRAIGVRHRDPALQPVAAEYATSRLDELADDDVVVTVVETGRPQHIPRDATAQVRRMFGPTRARDLLDRLAPDAVLILPLTGPAGPVGMVSLANGADRGDFAAADVVSAHHVAARAGLVLDNARLYRQQRELAETLQRSMLSAPVEPEHSEIVVRYSPAAQGAQIGGDWYDAFVQDDGATVVTIGDVSGHDVAAAATMGQLRSVLRGIAVSGAGPAAILRGVDHTMQSFRFPATATAIVARLDHLDDGNTRLRWSNAGHLEPLLVTADGRVEWLETPRPELLLGFRADAARTQSERLLAPGSVVLLYTDGLVERRDEDMEDGLGRLRDAVAQLSAELLAGRLDLSALCDRLLAGLMPDAPQDDVALLAVRLRHRDRPPGEAQPPR
ncbi:SpoIIE family protein phosphatase [Jatrophihabitans fulvus]